MTLPDERYRAIMHTADFLLSLCSAARTPRVPKSIREEARRLLRHYPTYYDMQQLESLAPEVVQERMEPLHRMVAAYESMTPETVNDSSK